MNSYEKFMQDIIMIPDEPIHVVLEHHRRGHDSRVHGVYADRRSARRKKEKIEAKKHHGYVCILSMRIKDLRTVRIDL